MADGFTTENIVNPGQKVDTEYDGTRGHRQRQKMVIGDLDVDGGDVSPNNPMPIKNQQNLTGVIGGVETDTVLDGPYRRPDSFESVLESANITSATTLQAGATNAQIFVTDVAISTDTAMWIKLQDDNGSPNTIVPKKYLPANSVWTKQYKTPKMLNVGAALKVIGSATGNVSVEVNGYILQPT